MAKTKTKSKPKKQNVSLELKVEAIRDGFGRGLLKIVRLYPEVVALSADLTESVRMSDFEKKHPERFFQTGIAEQNMAGIAAGLALSGYIPFIGSFACFQPYRNLDQIRTSICMMNANVKIISSHAAFSYAADGIQVQALEDIGIMRMLPNMTVIVPADAEQAEDLTQEMVKLEGPVYLRLGREKTPVLSARKAEPRTEKFTPVEIGKAQIIREGLDITIIACGYMVVKALDAAIELSKQGISAQVINLHTIKPLDSHAILTAAKKTGYVLTVEEHQVAGGMGSAVAELLAQAGDDVKFKMLGVNDQFGQTAKTSDELWEAYGLTSARIITEAQRLISR
jgi:transketolase